MEIQQVLQPLCGVAIDLFDDINFGGSFRTIITSLADFRAIDFNDRASSAIVRPLPGFVTGDAIRLWSDINFRGAPLDLGPGQYPDFRIFNFNDVASSAQCIRVGVPVIIAEDRQRETLTFRLQLIPPPGATILSVQANRILNLQASGTFIGPTTVRVTGSFLDEIVLTIREATGVVRTAIGRVTIPFTKNITFPQLAGVPLTNLTIVVTAQNPTSTFSLVGNILTKNVSFDLITQVIRQPMATSNAVDGSDCGCDGMIYNTATLDLGDLYEVNLEVVPEE